jgi:hypothetical protein
VLLLGLIMATLEKVIDELGSEELRFRVVFAREAKHPSPLVAERELCELALREWRDKGVVTIVESTLAEEAEALAEQARRALVLVVVFTTDPSAARARWTTAATANRLDAACVVHDVGLARPADLGEWGVATTDVVASLL